MPLALLLQKVTAALTATATTLTPWIDIAAREATIVERARSAFLMHWFGRRLPMEGLAVRAHIVNVSHLNAQFLAAQRSVARSSGGANLTEPLLGVAGMIGGILLSPAGMIAGVSLLWRFSAFSLGVLLAGLAWIVAPFLLGFGLLAAPAGTSILALGGLLASGGGFALASALGNRRDIRAVYEALGSLARLMNAAVLLLDQLTGPRAEVRNPLLAKVLAVADRLAALLAQLLGAVAVLIVKVAPVLEPVAKMLLGIGRLTGTVIATIAEVMAGFFDRLTELRTGDLSIGSLLDRAVNVARAQLTKAARGIGAPFDMLTAALAEVGAELATKGGEFLDKASDFILNLFLDHPIARTINAFRQELALIKVAFAAPHPVKPAKPPSISLPTLPTLPPVQSFPPLPTVPDAKALGKRLGAGKVPVLNRATIEGVAADLALVSIDAPPVELSAAARAAIAGTGRRPSIFASGHNEVPAGLRREPTGFWDLDPGQIARFRETFGLIVGRVLPAELRGTALPGLVDPEALPVLDLPTTDELRPVVTKLVLRMPGANPIEVRRFQDLVVDRLQGRTYPAPVGGR